jgi:hypothetical protein
MSLSQEAMMELMAYADGELVDDAAATARMEQLVESNEEARRIVDAMRTLGDVVRELPEAQGPVSAVADSIADGVMAQLERAPIERPDMNGVVPLQARRAIGRAHYAAAAAGVLALAAGIALMLRTNGPTPGPVATDVPHETAPVVQPAASGGGASEPAPSAAVAQNDPAPQTAPGASEPAPGDPKNDVDLEEVESQDHHVSVFYVPKSLAGASAHAGASVVVWIDDHGGH